MTVPGVISPSIVGPFLSCVSQLGSARTAAEASVDDLVVAPPRVFARSLAVVVAVGRVIGDGGTTHGSADIVWTRVGLAIINPLPHVAAQIEDARVIALAARVGGHGSDEAAAHVAARAIVRGV